MAPRLSKLILLYGFTGAGKTTYAKKLAAETGAVRFSNDEWMVRLFGVNPPAAHFQDYVERIGALIWDLAEDFISRGHDVIMDSGFWSRASRDEAYRKAKDWGATVELIHVQCPENIMLQRVLKRTAELPDGALVIDENAFHLFKERFDPLGDDEPHRVVNTNATGETACRKKPPSPPGVSGA